MAFEIKKMNFDNFMDFELKNHITYLIFAFLICVCHVQQTLIEIKIKKWVKNSAASQDLHFCSVSRL
jgi:hypothetical protein